MSEMKDILMRLSEICDQCGIKYTIIGGVAAMIRGRPRTTMDIDLIVENNQQKITQFLKLLKIFDFDVLDEQIQRMFKERASASVFDLKSALRLDIKCATEDIDINTLQNSQIIKYENISISVASVEDILLGKIWFLGDISKIPDSELLEYNDVHDFLNVLALNRSSINYDVLFKRSVKLGLEKTYERLVSYFEQNFVVWKKE